MSAENEVRRKRLPPVRNELTCLHLMVGVLTWTRSFFSLAVEDIFPFNLQF
jgi:hypothetical protein